MPPIISQSGWLNGDQIFIDMKNIFDTQPPFYNYAVPSNVNSSKGINTFVSNPIGRYARSACGSSSEVAVKLG